MISDQLKAIIKDSRESRYSIAQKTGIRDEILRKFMKGESSISFATFEKLAAYFNISLKVSKQKKV